VVVRDHDASRPFDQQEHAIFFRRQIAQGALALQTPDVPEDSRLRHASYVAAPDPNVTSKKH
jgi:hypothetical protein